MVTPANDLQLTASQLTTLKANDITHVKATYDQEVKIGEFQTLVITGNPEFVTTEGLGPCLGMLLVSKDPKVILGLHFPDPIQNNPEVVPKFLELIDLLKINIAKAEIAVAGLSPTGSRSYKVTSEYQDYILSAIEQKGFSRKEIKVAWSDIDSGCSIDFDRDRRKLSITKTDDPIY